MGNDLTPSLQAIAELANGYAARSAFADYQQKCSANTRTRQHADLSLFCLYLSEVHIAKLPEHLLILNCLLTCNTDMREIGHRANCISIRR
jgi:hypothetical protein